MVKYLTKKKISIEKITKKNSLATCFTKQMKEETGLCFTHKDLGLGLGFGLDDESLENLKKKDVDLQNRTQSLNQTLNLQFTYAICTPHNCLKTDTDEVEEFATSLVTQDLNQTLNLPDDCINEFVVKNTKENGQIQTVSENFCNNNNIVPKGNLHEDLDIDQLTDLATSFESLIDDGFFESYQEFQEFASSLLMNFEDIYEDNLTNPNLFSDYEDDLCFSDVFSGL